jgi:sarcosine oxidase subunit gamma
MADRLSALVNLAAPPTAEGAGARLAELRPAAIAQVTAWPDTTENTGKAIGELFDTVPGPVGMAIENGSVTVITTAPGRFLLVSESDDLAGVLSAALPAADAAITDLSHARTMLRLSGEAAADSLGKGLAIDLHPSVFPAGRAAQSVIHHMDVLVIRRENEVFDLVVFRSFGLSLAEWLLDAGLEYEIGFQSS